MDQYNADITEPPHHNWHRVNTAVMTQVDGQIHDHALDFHMLEVCINGRHNVQSDSLLENGDRVESVVQPGKLAYAQPGVSMTQTCQGRAEFQQVYIDNSIFEDCADNLFKGDSDNIVSLGFQGIFDPHIKSLLLALLEEARRPGIGTDLTADLIAQQLAILILRRQNSKQLREPKCTTLSDVDLDRIVAYFEEQIEDIGGMDTVAGLVNMDVYSFTRSFKETTGQTPGQFLIQRRLMRVKDLLLGTKDTLADITYATGFSNQAHMTSTFSKHVGISPGRWRKAVKS